MLCINTFHLNLMFCEKTKPITIPSILAVLHQRLNHFTNAYLGNILNFVNTC